MKSPNIEAILQKIKQSTEKQRELEADQVKTFDKLNNARSNKIEEVPSLQSQLRELEKKVELERVQYEELMLELSLTKRHDKDREEININSSQLPLYTPASSIFSVGQITSYNSLSQSSTPVPTTSSITAPTALYNNNIRDDIDQVSAINNINAMLAQATSSIRNENDSLLAGLAGVGGGRTEEIKKQQMHILEQGPKFVSDEEIERIKAKIEEDNRAIAALESKKYDSFVPPRSTTITRYDSPSHTINSELRSEDKNGLLKHLDKEFGLSSITGSASSPYIPSSDFSPLPPLRSTAGPSSSSVLARHNRSLTGALANILDGPLSHYSLASPSYEPQISHVSPLMSASQQEPLLDNSNLCDILMLERALENEAAMSAVMGHT